MNGYFLTIYQKKNRKNCAKRSIAKSGNVRLSEMEESLINEMENSELLTMDAFFERALTLEN